MTMKRDDFDDAVQSSDTPAPAPHTAPEHVLQEEHTQVEENCFHQGSKLPKIKAKSTHFSKP